MPEYVAVKLKNGKDLVGIILHDEREFVTIDSPLEISVHPVHGMFAKSWLMLSEHNSVDISRSDLFFVQTANDKAVSYYEEFKERLVNIADGRDSVSEDDLTSDLEEMFSDLMESRSSTKH
jgi:hypothetical protein